MARSTWKGVAGGGGQAFDINGDGQTDRTSFVSGGDAFLALDLNGNGFIDNGTELFGDQRGARNGMEELARYDENRDGRITKEDSAFSRLLAFYGAERRGTGSVQVFKPIAELGIKSLKLDARATDIQRADGNVISALSEVEMQDGSTRAMADADLIYK